jgi:hypothetical protein
MDIGENKRKQKEKQDGAKKKGMCKSLNTKVRIRNYPS